MTFDLKQFHFERILNEGDLLPSFLQRDFSTRLQSDTDPLAHAITLLGSLLSNMSGSDDVSPSAAIIRIEKTALPAFSDDLVGSTKLIESTDIVSPTSLPISP